MAHSKAPWVAEYLVSNEVCNNYVSAFGLYCFADVCLTRFLECSLHEQISNLMTASKKQKVVINLSSHES